MSTRTAMLAVAEHAQDAADCRLLLDMLGLTAPPAKRKRGRPSVDYGHGDYRTYRKGCRCADCREAHRCKAGEDRVRRAKDPAAADRAGHGRASTYKNYACRCRPCTTAHSAYLAEGRERRRERKAMASAGGAR